MDKNLLLAAASLCALSAFVTAVALLERRHMRRQTSAKFEPIMSSDATRVLGYECLRHQLGPGPWANWHWYYALIRWLSREIKNEPCQGDRDCYYSINFDSAELTGLRFRLWARRTARHHLAERILIEWTEHTRYRNEQRMDRARLKAARALIRAHLLYGFRLAIDDWGDGMDAMGRLALLAGSASVVKISHRLFHHSRESMRIAGAIGHMVEAAHSCKTRVVIEGIENTGDLARAVAARADAVQGYLYEHRIVELNASA